MYIFQRSATFLNFIKAAVCLGNISCRWKIDGFTPWFLRGPCRLEEGAEGIHHLMFTSRLSTLDDHLESN